MYRISDRQIDFILNDIRARGVEMEDLQYNLLDHICCIIEQNLEENGNFEDFYQRTISTFYKDALWEIEEETISLLIFKHYYTMKKLMIWSGAFSALTLIIGIWFKYMHWPGATVFACGGFLSGSLVFLPLLFTLKAKEKKSAKEKFIMGIGALGVILVSLSFLFRVMHWGHSIDMVYLSAALMLLVFLPLYFFTGIRQPETKLNTITTSMLVILVYGLLFMMIRTPYSAIHTEIKANQELGIGLEILMNERRLTTGNQNLISPTIRGLHEQMDKVCDESKTYLFWRDTDMDTTSDSHEWKFDYNRRLVTDPFNWDQTIQEKLNKLAAMVTEYNLELSKIGNKKLSRIRVTATLLDSKMEGTSMLSAANVLNQLTQIQMFILQNTRTLLATK